MKTRLAPSWSLRLITLAVWLVAVLCGAYWALKFVTVKPVNANAAAFTPAIVVDSSAVAKLLGAIDNVAGKATITPASSNYALFGLAMTGGGQGVALIATDGKPAKPYRVGSKVADDLVLKSVSRTEAILATSVNAADGMKLELPVRQPASTSVSALAPGRTAFPALPIAPMMPATVAPSPMPTSTAQTTPSTYIPGAGGAAGGAAAAMANLKNNPATQIPGSTGSPDSTIQMPVSRFAPPPQSEMSNTGRIPQKSPASDGSTR